MITPGSANALLLADAGYQIQRSVRTRGAYPTSPSYFSRTAGAPTNNLKWTFSSWVKRGVLSVGQNILNAGTGTSASEDYLHFLGSNKLAFYQGNASTTVIATNAVFRDPSAWYHIVLAYDSAQATAANRLFIYVNGVSQSFSSATYPTLNQATNINASGVLQRISSRTYLADEGFDGYLTEVNFIDGQALTPASFGEINPVTGVWAAKKYAGTYGTNGFYLNFSDPSAATAAAIGKDSSGNGNNWTPSGISVTAGATYDSMLDVPLGAGGAERGNYAIWNPLGGSGVAVTDGNLKALNSATSYLGCFGSIALPSSGKFYFEAQLTANAGGSNIANFGIAPTNTSLSGNQVGATNSASMYCNTTISINGSDTVRGSVALATDVFQACYDAATGKVYLGINNTFYQSNGTSGGDPANGTNPSRTLTAGELAAWMFGYQIGWTINFGQRPFAYTPPTGFKALHTGNLPDAVIKLPAQYMAATTWTGNGSTQSISNAVNGVSFQPDLLWTKGRSAAWGNFIHDSVRGFDATPSSRLLLTDSTSAELTTSPALVSAFTTSGFTVGANGNSNANANTYVAWQWKANGAAVTNTAGSITSQVSAGVSQGFSVVTYTGTGANATVGHGLGVAPKMIIVKNRTAVTGWPTYHTGQSATPANNFLMLNETAATGVLSTIWNNTAPTSTVFSIGTSALVNGAYSFVAYCFSEVAGFSKFGSYVGNGSADGPFVFCGFRPRFVLIKNSSASGWNWFVWDTARSVGNESSLVLLPNASDAELSNRQIDILSNGFKIRATDTHTNGSGNTMIFAAFAEHPFKNSLAR